MNNLVDYGADSDEELTSPINPTATDSNLLVVPPESTAPPQNEDKASGLKPSFSQSALYERDVADNFDKEDFEKQEEGDSVRSTEEPKPPKRPDDDNEDDKSDSLDETEIDSVVKEGLNALKFRAEDVEMGCMTPNSNGDSGNDDTTPRRLPEKRFDMPPSPPGECNPMLEALFASFFEKKSSGMQMNQVIQQHKGFKNPAIYEFLVNEYDIDEKGTNFPPEIFNPHRFNPEDFYDALADGQRRHHERMTSAEAAARKTAAASAAADAPKSKKTRFEK